VLCIRRVHAIDGYDLALRQHHPFAMRVRNIAGFVAERLVIA
jgi:hypothetical protein